MRQGIIGDIFEDITDTVVDIGTEVSDTVYYIIDTIFGD